MSKIKKINNDSLKYCPGCMHNLPLSFFNKNNNISTLDKQKYQTYCKSCQSKLNKRIYKVDDFEIKLNKMVEKEFSKIKETIKEVVPNTAYPNRRSINTSKESSVLQEDNLRTYEELADYPKTCPGCKRELAYKDFGKDRYHVVSTYCKQCIKERSLKLKLKKELRLALVLKGEGHL